VLHAIGHQLGHEQRDDLEVGLVDLPAEALELAPCRGARVVTPRQSPLDVLTLRLV
jgi:hypothetical protein